MKLTICLVLMFSATLVSSIASAEVGLVSYTECQVNGYTVGTSTSMMIEQLGEPLPPPKGNPDELVFDVMQHSFDYDGLIVVFGQSFDQSWAFRILGDGFQLKSGIGVGSKEQKVLNYYGPTDEVIFDKVKILPYKVTSVEGKPTAYHLDFTIDDGIVTRVDAHLRPDDMDRLPYY